MISGRNFLLCLVVFGVCTFVGWHVYQYIFDTTEPTLTLSGVENNNYYAGDTTCTICGSDRYKVSSLMLILDGKPLTGGTFKINSSKFQQQFTLPTKTLSNGPHVLVAEIVKGNRNPLTCRQECTFYVDNTSLQAAFVKQESEFKVFQGRTLHLQFQTNKPIKSATVQALSQTFDCYPESKNSLIYECFIPIECDEQPNEYPLTLAISDQVGNTLTLESKFQVVAFPFKRHTISVNPAKVEEEKRMGVEQKKLNEDLEQLAHASPKQKLWRGAFSAPTEIQRISTEFGVIRTTQERGQYAHKAIDIVNTPKAVVWAPQDGIVVLKERYGYSGNTVVIDHGCGILSLFFHLENFADINVGDTIRKGNPIGTLGMTGYATGYHLHWEMRINNVPVDPLQWTKNNF